MKEINRFYKILDLETEASLEEVIRAYRDLVKVWHPDRFQDNQRLKKKANDKLVEINEAYEKITLHISHKEQIIREEPEDQIFDEPLRRDDHDIKSSDIFSEIVLVSLLGVSILSDEFKYYISHLNEKADIDPQHGWFRFKNNGIDFHFSSGALYEIYLFSEGFNRSFPPRHGYKQYSGIIPGDLKFSDDRQTTNKKLGLPPRSSSKPVRQGRWDSHREPKGGADFWVFSEYSMHVEYDQNGRIEMVCLGWGGLVKEKEAKEGNSWQALWKGLR